MVVNRRANNPFGLGDESQSLAPEETLRRMLIRDLVKSPYDESDDENSGSTDKPGSSGDSMKHIYDRFLSMQPELPKRSDSSDSFWPQTKKGDRADSSESKDPGSRRNDSEITLSSPNRLFGFDSGSDFSSRGDRQNGLMDQFGLRNDRVGETEQLLENKRAEGIQKRQLDDYKAMVGYSATPLFDFSQLPSSGTRNPLSMGGPAAPVMAPDPYNPFALTPANVNPTLDPGLLAPTAPQAPVPSSLSAIPFTPQQPRTLAPKPIFSIPQRAF